MGAKWRPPWTTQKVDDDHLEEYDAELAVRRALWGKEKLLPPLGAGMPIRNTFEMLLQVLMVYTGIFVPLYSCFQIPYHPAQLVVDYLIDMCFWFDIALTMRTAYYNQNHELVTDKKEIQRTYMKKRLRLDIIANFPFELFTLLAGHSTTSAAFSAWRLWRMLRFCRMKRLHPKILVDLNASGPRRLVNFFPLITHWVACLWFAIGLSGPSNGDEPPALLALRPERQGGSSWLMRPNYNSILLGSETNLQAYVSSLYWASATLMKTAYVNPATTEEKLFTCVILLIGAVMFAVFLGQVFKILARLDEGSAQRREKMAMFRLFCDHNKLSAPLSHKVLSYAMAEWNVTLGVSTGETLKLLSHSLAGQLLYEMRKDVLEACPVTSSTSLSCAKKLLARTTVQVCIKNEYVLGCDELARELLILVKGSLKISLPSAGSKRGSKSPARGDDSCSPTIRVGSKKNLMQFRMLESMGCITGLWRPYENGLRYPFEVQAKEFTTMLNIGRQALLEVMGTFDEDRPKIQKVLDQEYELVQQALRISGGRMKGSMRETSTRSSPGGREVDAAASLAESAKAEELQDGTEQLGELNTTLEGVNVGLAKTHEALSTVNGLVVTLPAMLEKLGGTVSADEKERFRFVETPPSRSSSRASHSDKSPSGGRSHPSAVQRFADMQQQQQQQLKSGAGEDDKREITAANSKSSGDVAAVIVL